VFGKVVYTYPQLFLDEIKFVSVNIAGLTGTSAAVFAISDTGVAYSFGNNALGYLADGSIIDRIEPIVSSIESEHVFGFDIGILVYQSRIEFWFTSYSHLKEYQPMVTNMMDSRATKIIANGRQVFVLTESGSIYGVGSNANGDLGDGSRTDANVPISFAKSSIFRKKIKSLTDGLGVTEDNHVFMWGKSLYNCFGTSSKIPKIVATLSSSNYTLIGTSSNSLIGPRVFTNNEIISCGQRYAIIPGKTITKVGQFSGTSWWMVTTDAEIIISNARLLSSRYPKLCTTQNGNCTIVDSYLPYFTAFEISRIGGYLHVAGGEEYILFVMEDGRSYLYLDGVYTPFEKMDTIAQIGTPDLYVLANGTLLYGYAPMNFKTLDRVEEYPKVLSAAATYDGIIALYASCSQHFVGLKCDIAVCDGIPANYSRTCNGGRCVSPQVCQCSSEYSGKYCTECSNRFFVGSQCNIPSQIAYVVVFLSVALALTLLVIIIVFALACLIRYRASIIKIREKENQMRDMLSVKLIEYDQLKDENDELLEKVDRDWVIPLSEIHIIERISRGSYGTVMKGSYKGLEV
jgi:hypothetical protein